MFPKKITVRRLSVSRRQEICSHFFPMIPKKMKDRAGKQCVTGQTSGNFYRQSTKKEEYSSVQSKFVSHSQPLARLSPVFPTKKTQKRGAEHHFHQDLLTFILRQSTRHEDFLLYLQQDCFKVSKLFACYLQTR